MQGQDQNDKMMSTSFRKQSEHLEYAIDRVIVTISERRRARTLHGTNEQPPYSIITAALELINVVKMLLNLLERPPFDCMAEFSSLKSHLIKHITLLKQFSEQPDLSHEMESDMIDVCKGVTKICHYIISLPPNLSGPERKTTEMIALEERSSQVQMPMSTTSSSNEHIFSIQDMSLPNEIVPRRFEYFSPETSNTSSNEGAVMMRRDKVNKSETELSEAKPSETSFGSLDYKSLHDLTIIESGLPPQYSGTERCKIDSDSDESIGLHSNFEQHSKDSDSVMWGMDSDSDKYPRDSDSMKCLIEGEKHWIISASMEDLLESERCLVGVKECKIDFDSLKHWVDSDSEKRMTYSDLEKYVTDSDNEQPETDSDSEKFPVASSSVKHWLTAEKDKMASDSIKRLMKSEESFIETEQHSMLSTSEMYVVDSDLEWEEGDRIDSKSSRLHFMGEKKQQEKFRYKNFMTDSDSESHETNSESERHELASAAVKCFMDAKTLSTDSKGQLVDLGVDRHRINLDAENLGMASDSMKHKMKAENCQKSTKSDRFWMGINSERCWTDSEEQLDFDYGRYFSSSGRYQNWSERLLGNSKKYQDDIQTHWDNIERHQIELDSTKQQTMSENERSHIELGNERYMMEEDKKQFLIKLTDRGIQMDKEKDRDLLESDSKKKYKIAISNERQHLESENEAQRLGARKKDNRPWGFWRPVLLSPSLDQGKESEEKLSVQQIDNKEVSRIQLVRYLSDDKIMQLKEVSPTLRNKQDSQQNLKEKHSHSFSTGSIHMHR